MKRSQSAPTTASQTSGWLPTLDGWRAVAISLVLWHHATMSWYRDEPSYWNNSLSSLGAFGVDIFFALSGLLITHLLLREAANSRISLRAFYVRRVFRILPPLFAFLVVGVAIGRIPPGIELLSSALLFRNYLPASLWGHTTAHLWSLSIEEHFYLIWPLLLVFVRRRNNPNLVAYLAIAAGLWRIADMQNGFTAALFADVPEHARTDHRLDALLWGCFAAFLLNNAKTAEKIRSDAGPAWFAAGLAAAITGMILYSGLAGLWMAMLLPMLLLLTLLHPEWRVSRFLDVAPIRFLGRISYSLYLWQQLFLVPGWNKNASWWTEFPLNLGFAFAAAIGSYYLVEKPCISFGRRLAEQLRSRFHLVHSPFPSE